MDVQMPELDGLEATKQIRALESGSKLRVPIIALTAGASKEEKERCLAAGMDDFLSKPIEIRKLSEMLNRYLF
jgi:CheY-like chemotaxis protein